jgi:hypothetical protein
MGNMCTSIPVQTTVHKTGTCPFRRSMNEHTNDVPSQNLAEDRALPEDEKY